MDNARAFEDDRMGHDIDTAETGVEDARLDIATDERRMHVQAYNHWVSLLRERPCPSLADLDPANISDFGPYSVLLDFSKGIENPAIAFLGRALREECQLDFSVTHISQVPSRSSTSTSWWTARTGASFSAYSSSGRIPRCASTASAWSSSHARSSGSVTTQSTSASRLPTT